jgi:predicted flap endonuclease-1-like 5' DNA nuclease
MGIGMFRRRQREREAASQPVLLPKTFPAVALLNDAGIATYEDLSNVTADDLVKIKGIGKRTADEILSAVDVFNSSSTR